MMPGTTNAPPFARRSAPPFALALALAAALGTPAGAAGQDGAPNDLRIEATPARLTVTTGERVPFTARAVDASGRTVDVPLRIVGARSGVEITDGFVTGVAPGEHQVFVTAVLPAGSTGSPPSLTVPVVVTWPSVREIHVAPEAGTLYVGTSLTHQVEALHPDGTSRPDARVSWRSSDPRIA